MKQVGEEYNYQDLEYHDKDWCYAKDGRPLPYDMLEIEIKRWNWKRTVPGWWTGNQWYSIRTGYLNNIYRWRRNDDI